jgi:hypothetical protein
MKENKCHCHDWFMTFYDILQVRQSDMPAYVEYGSVRTLNLVRGTDEDKDDDIDDKPPSSVERRVFWLYCVLLKDFDNIPDESRREWLDFGFCFCRNMEWKRKMAHSYIELAHCASIAEIARFWEGSHYQLNDLFFVKGINISRFLGVGISFGQPRYDSLGTYRLMVEVQHFYLGIFCACAQFDSCRCKRFPESRLSVETVMDYGFDMLSPGSDGRRYKCIQRSSQQRGLKLGR